MYSLWSVYEWNIIKVGMDIKLCCEKCKKIITVSRKKFEEIVDNSNDKEKFHDTKNWIKHIKNPTLEEMRDSIIENPMTIRFLQDPPEEIINLALEINPMCITFIKDLTLEQQKLAIKGNIATIKFINQPIENVVDFAKKLYPHEMKQYFRGEDGNFIRMKNIEIEDFDKMSPETILTILGKNGEALQFIKNPTNDMIKKAIGNQPSAIRFVHNPTDEIKTYAVKKSPQKMKKYTVCEDGTVKAITEECKNSIFDEVIIKMSKNEKVLSKHPDILCNLDEVPYETQLFVVKMDYANLQYIKKIDPRIYEYLYDDKNFDLYSLYDNFSLQLKLIDVFKAIEKKREIVEDAVVIASTKKDLQTAKKNVQSILDNVEKMSYSINIIDGEIEIDAFLNELSKEIGIETINIASGFLYKSGLVSLQELFQSVYEKNGQIQMIIGSLKDYYSASSDKKLLNIDLETARELNDMIVNHK